MLKIKLILFLISLGMFAKAQVYRAGTHFPYYYDINPDTLFAIGSGPGGNSHSYTQTYLFNIDSDSMADFKLDLYDVGSPGGASRAVNFISLDTNCFVCFGRIDSVYHGFHQYWITTPMAKPLRLHDSLNSLSHNWKKTALSILNNSGSAGTYTHPTDWVSTNDLYVAIKYQSLTDTVYGWVRINCPSIQQCYVKDYSFSKCLTIPSLTVASSSSVTCASEPVTISISGAGSYSWSTGSTSPSITVFPAITTTYTVEGTNIYGCLETAIITQSVVTCAGIREYDSYEIKIYPNPTTTILNVTDAENRFINSEVEILNYLGQRVYLQDYSDAIDVSKVPVGIYTLKIKAADNKYYYSRFIKEG